MGNLEAISKLTQDCEQKAFVASGSGDPEIQAMNEEAPLLELIRSDTGEGGHASADRIDFDICPVCGHRDCFRYYPETNSWNCFSDSNKTGFEGGTYLEYLKAVHGCDDSEAVRRLRDATGNPRDIIKSTVSSSRKSEQCLPPWRRVNASNPPELRPALIPGILRLGHVAVLAGKGKIGKTQAVIQLAIAVATNGDWFGYHIENGGKVLHIDPECDAKSLDNRYSRACEVLGVDKRIVDEMVTKWPLRGTPSVSVENLNEYLEEHASHGEFALIIVDSCSVFVKGDENSSLDVRRFGSLIMRMAEITGAAVLCIHHFGKATDGSRSASDRARGSSVWLDFPDALLTLTEIFPPSGEPSDYLDEGEYGVVLESGGLREFPRMQPVHLVAKEPIFRLDASGITAKWKVKSAQREGGKTTGSLNAANAKADWLEKELALMRMFAIQGISDEGLPVDNASEICDERPDRLSKKIREKSSCFYIEKRGRKNHIMLKSEVMVPEV